jgi:glycosyltransferase involved in cell wall biosynthesis
LERGFAVDLVQATPGNDFRHAVPEGARLVDLNARRALSSLPPLVRYLRRERPQVLISGAIQTNLVAVWAKWLAHIPLRLILTEHNVISGIIAHASDVRARTTPFFVRRFYPWADDLLCVSLGVAKDLSGVLRDEGRTIHVVYNPIISPEFWQNANAPFEDPRLNGDSRPIVLAVSRLHYHKDIPTLFQAFAILRQSVDARLILLGDGEERGRLEILARDLGIEASVKFLGSVENPLPYMKVAKVLALSSLEEGLPTVLIEALAVGLPIVSTDCEAGPREILRDGAYGTLVPVGDSSGMADAILNVLRGSQLPKIPQEALDRFQRDRVIDQYLGIMGIGTVSPQS